jgi:hypothetical protein
MEVEKSKMTFEKFCRDYIPAHPELKLERDNLSPTAFAKVAAEEGQKLGFTFSESEIWAVLGEHRQARRTVADLGGSVKASANGTAMCWSGDIRTEDPIEADWLVIKGVNEKKK